MKKFTILSLSLLLSASISFGQRISEMIADGVPSSVPFAAFNPTTNNASRPGDGQIIFPPNTNLSNLNVTLNAGTDASVTEPNPLPIDWSTTVSGVKITKNEAPNDWALYDITAKVIKPAALPMEIATANSSFDSNSWTTATIGWAGACIDKNQSVIRFGSAKRSFMLAFTDVPAMLKYSIKFLNPVWDAANVFDVDGSADGINWTSIKQYNAETAMPTSTTPAGEVEIELAVNENYRFIRWIYTTRNSTNVALEGITVTKGVASSVGSIYSSKIGAFLAHGNNTLMLKDNSMVSELSLYNISGALIYNNKYPQQSNAIPQLTKGIYLLKMKLTNGTVVSEKLMKQ